MHHKHHATNLMSAVISTSALDAAFAAIYQKRKKDHANSDIWALSRNWAKIRQTLQAQLLAGTYLLSPISAYSTKKGRLTRWSAQDAVVLKALSQIITPHVSQIVGLACCHLKDHGGLKGGVRQVKTNLKDYRYVLKSDVASFYDSMDHQIVLETVKESIKDKRIISLIHQYMNRVEVDHGEHRLIEVGIPKGCPLSPLMGALILKSLDASLSTDGAYVRYMDDWVILTKTRNQLRGVVKKMHRVMKKLKFKLALDKTFIGKISKGFDFLGYRFNHQGLVGLAKTTIQNFNERIAKLYEQGADEVRILQYVRRWVGWCLCV